jgi:hypothetical protein
MVKESFQNSSSFEKFPRVLKMFILLFCLALTAESSWLGDTLKRKAIESMGFDASDTCGFTRADALNCFAKYVDTNKDGEISAAEFEHAKQAYMPPRMRELVYLAKKFYFDFTIKDVLNGCDANKDGRLTIQDFHESEKTCLPGRQDLCEVKTVCDIAAKTNEK